VDALRELGAVVHLAHPLGVKAFEYRRVKNDERDAADLADLLRMGRLPKAWIAPPTTRELRELEVLMTAHRAAGLHAGWRGEPTGVQRSGILAALFEPSSWELGDCGEHEVCGILWRA